MAAGSRLQAGQRLINRGKIMGIRTHKVATRKAAIAMRAQHDLNEAAQQFREMEGTAVPGIAQLQKTLGQDCAKASAQVKRAARTVRG